MNGRGNGLLSAAIAAMADGFGIALGVVGYEEHALTRGSDAQAVAYLQCARPNGSPVFGVGIDSDVAGAGG